jgi:hypothetical protein
MLERSAKLVAGCSGMTALCIAGLALWLFPGASRPEGILTQGRPAEGGGPTPVLTEGLAIALTPGPSRQGPTLAGRTREESARGEGLGDWKILLDVSDDLSEDFALVVRWYREGEFERKHRRDVERDREEDAVPRPDYRDVIVYVPADLPNPWDAFVEYMRVTPQRREEYPLRSGRWLIEIPREPPVCSMSVEGSRGQRVTIDIGFPWEESPGPHRVRVRRMPTIVLQVLTEEGGAVDDAVIDISPVHEWLWPRWEFRAGDDGLARLAWIEVDVARHAPVTYALEVRSERLGATLSVPGWEPASETVVLQPGQWRRAHDGSREAWPRSRR